MFSRASVVRFSALLHRTGGSEFYVQEQFVHRVYLLVVRRRLFLRPAHLWRLMKTQVGVSNDEDLHLAKKH